MAAGAGIKVAKHGNRAMSSKSGAADVLTALGVNIQASPRQTAGRWTRPTSAFCSPAPTTAPCVTFRPFAGTRISHNLQPARPPGQPGRRPAAGPGRVRQSLGGALGARCWAAWRRRAWVVHGQGLDEITTTGPTEVAEWRKARSACSRSRPSREPGAGGPDRDLRGGDPASTPGPPRPAGGAAGAPTAMSSC